MKHDLCTKHSRIFLGVLSVVLLSSCTALESPQISLSDMAIPQTTGFETVLQVSLRVLNPNDTELNIRGVDCTLEINGKPFARGISSASVQVPPFDSATVPVAVYTSAIDIARSLISMPGRDDVSYAVKGKLRLEKTGWLRSALPFKTGGTMAIQDFKSWLAPRTQ